VQVVTRPEEQGAVQADKVLGETVLQSSAHLRRGTLILRTQVPLRPSFPEQVLAHPRQCYRPCSRLSRQLYLPLLKDILHL
jgi:hypothetical protein